MSITDPFIRRPVMSTLVMTGILGFGLFAFQQLPVSDLPNVDFPTLQITEGELFALVLDQVARGGDGVGDDLRALQRGFGGPVLRRRRRCLSGVVLGRRPLAQRPLGGAGPAAASRHSRGARHPVRRLDMAAARAPAGRRHGNGPGVARAATRFGVRRLGHSSASALGANARYPIGDDSPNPMGPLAGRGPR